MWYWRPSPIRFLSITGAPPGLVSCRRRPPWGRGPTGGSGHVLVSRGPGSRRGMLMGPATCGRPHQRIGLQPALLVDAAADCRAGLERSGLHGGESLVERCLDLGAEHAGLVMERGGGDPVV